MWAVARTAKGGRSRREHEGRRSPRRRRTALAACVAAALLAGLTVALVPRPASQNLVWFEQTAAAVEAQAAEPDPVRTRSWALAWWAADRAVHGARVAGRDSDGPAQRAAEDAAVATAVHDVLVALVPSRRRELDRALDRAPGQRSEAGRRAAAAVLAERRGDGLTSAEINRPVGLPTPAPGSYRPTPPQQTRALQGGQGAARPFLVRSVADFDPGPPPALASLRYRRDLAEVARLGVATGSDRTPEQTELARFWGVSLVTVLAEVLRVAVLPGRTDPEQAALLSRFWRVSLDAQLAVYASKYRHLFWRPVTALREGAVPPGPMPFWRPLLATPPQPEYPSAHTCIAAAAARVLEAAGEPAGGFGLTSPGAPGATRRYTRWQQLVSENVDARVYAGVHFRTSDEVGARLGRAVAQAALTQIAGPPGTLSR